MQIGFEFTTPCIDCIFELVYNNVMFTKTDDRIVGLWEYQRKGLGMILAGISIIFFWY